MKLFSWRILKGLLFLQMEEEEEIRRLRKELVPKAQPMPYFDRPFIPKRWGSHLLFYQAKLKEQLHNITNFFIRIRSDKHPTIPKDPKFNLPQQKKIKCYLSMDDFTAHCRWTMIDGIMEYVMALAILFWSFFSFVYAIICERLAILGA